MAYQTAFRTLAFVLGELEASGMTVVDVSLPAQSVRGDDALYATVTTTQDLFDDSLDEVTVSLPSGESIDRGELRMTFDLRVDVETGDIETTLTEKHVGTSSGEADGTSDRSTGVAFLDDARERADAGDASEETDGNDPLDAGEDGASDSGDPRAETDDPPPGDSRTTDPTETRTGPDEGRGSDGDGSASPAEGEQPTADDPERSPAAETDSDSDGTPADDSDTAENGTENVTTGPGRAQTEAVGADPVRTSEDERGEADDDGELVGDDDGVGGETSADERDAEATADHGDTVPSDPDAESGDPDAESGDPETEDAETDESVPSYRNPDLLREVYDEHETFREMTSALGADVTPQTVRHHMIKHGIHTPQKNDVHEAIEQARENGGVPSHDDGDESGTPRPDSDTADDPTTGTDEDTTPETTEDHAGTSTSDESEGETPSADAEDPDGTDGTDEADGAHETGASTDGNASSARDEPSAEEVGDAEEVDEPADLDPSRPLSTVATLEAVEGPDLTVADVRDAVYRSTTLYETQRRLDLTRTATTELLQELDLLEFVTGRLSSRDRDPVPREEITARIQSAADGNPGDV